MKTEPLGPAQQEAQKEGVAAVRGQPTLEALQAHPSAWNQPPPSAMATRDLAVHPLVAQQLAASLVEGDLPPMKQEVEDPLSDMPRTGKDTSSAFPQVPEIAVTVAISSRY